jgi:hypothetical protein
VCESGSQQTERGLTEKCEQVKGKKEMEKKKASQGTRYKWNTPPWQLCLFFLDPFLSILPASGVAGTSMPSKPTGARLKSAAQRAARTKRYEVTTVASLLQHGRNKWTREKEG